MQKQVLKSWIWDLSLHLRPWDLMSVGNLTCEVWCNKLRLKELGACVGGIREYTRLGPFENEGLGL